MTFGPHALRHAGNPIPGEYRIADFGASDISRRPGTSS